MPDNNRHVFSWEEASRIVDDFVSRRTAGGQEVEAEEAVTAPTPTPPVDSEFVREVAEVLQVPVGDAEDLVRSWDTEEVPYVEPPRPQAARAQNTTSTASARGLSDRIRNAATTLRPTNTVAWTNPNEQAQPSYSGISHIQRKDLVKMELPKWGYDEREKAVDLFFAQLDYKIRWIFLREEREGFSRSGRYGVTPFSPSDFGARKSKAKPHPLDTDTNKFYDWAMGGTDFILRLELHTVHSTPCLRCHIIHKPTGKQLGYQDRAWDGDKFYEVEMKWADVK